MILLLQSYAPASLERRQELADCLKQNRESGLFEEIVAVDGDEKRWTFNDFFRMAADRFLGKQCLLANSDISFRHPSCELFERIVKPGILVALTRWHDEASPWIVGYQVKNRLFSGTQDVWGFVGGQYVDIGDIPMGEPGCDCRLTAQAAAAGAVVWNPALTIRVMHVHKELNSCDRAAPAGEYGYAELTTIESLGGVYVRQFTNTKMYEYGQNRGRSI